MRFTLRKSSDESWGFVIKGGLDFVDVVPYFKTVHPNSVAQQHGICENDLLLAINGKSTNCMIHDEVKYHITRSSHELTLDVEKTIPQFWEPGVSSWEELSREEREQLPEGFTQKSSLAATNKRQEPSHIGCSHNRAPKPFYNATQENREAAANQGPSHIGCSLNRAPKPFYKAPKLFYSAAQGKVGAAAANLPDLLSSSNQPPFPSGFRSVKAPTTFEDEYYTAHKLGDIANCSVCGQMIPGGQLVVKVRDSIMHDFCYKCRSCGVLLKQIGYVMSSSGKLFCRKNCP